MYEPEVFKYLEHIPGQIHIAHNKYSLKILNLTYPLFNLNKTE